MILYPDILSQSFFSENEVEMLIKIPEELFYFQGHFTGEPIVAGVVQLHWVIKFAAKLFRVSDLITQASQIKFSKLMRPGDTLSLLLMHTPDKKMVSYVYKAAGHTYSSGRYCYR